MFMRAAIAASGVRPLANVRPLNSKSPTIATSICFAGQRRGERLQFAGHGVERLLRRCAARSAGSVVERHHAAGRPRPAASACRRGDRSPARLPWLPSGRSAWSAAAPQARSRTARAPSNSRPNSPAGVRVRRTQDPGAAHDRTPQRPRPPACARIDELHALVALELQFEASAIGVELQCAPAVAAGEHLDGLVLQDAQA